MRNSKVCSADLVEDGQTVEHFHKRRANARGGECEFMTLQVRVKHTPKKYVCERSTRDIASGDT